MSRTRPETDDEIPPGWEDPIVAEVRAARQQIFAEFNYDLDAYAVHLRELEQEARKRGVRYSDRPLATPHYARSGE
jgi:hypothetical protein